ncbi:transposase [Limihaloglobus sulfuriphilus]|nr:transposase [Limihaloglobus sulfuriphilus]
MPRPKRKIKGGYCYHVLNRANGRLRIFKKRDDFLAFERILCESQERINIKIYGWCIMSNHWHLLLEPCGDGDLSAFMHWLTVTHTMRHHSSHGTSGTGHIYQGSFKSFPVQQNHITRILRYIEANPLKAKMVDDAGDYRWSSFGCHIGRPNPDIPFRVSELPVKLPRNWKYLVHRDMLKKDVALIENSLKRGAPLGETEWVKKTAKGLLLESTINKRGRPFKKD